MLKILEQYPYFVNAITFLGGGLISFIGAYLKLNQDLSYIKGQIDQIVKLSQTSAAVVEKFDVLKTDLNKIEYNLEKTVIRIINLESKLRHGGQ